MTTSQEPDKECRNGDHEIAPDLGSTKPTRNTGKNLVSGRDMGDLDRKRSHNSENSPIKGRSDGKVEVENSSMADGTERDEPIQPKLSDQDRSLELIKVAESWIKQGKIDFDLPCL